MALQQKLEVRLKVILLNYFWIISNTQPEETGGFRASTFGTRQQATSISTWKSHSFLLLSLEDNLIKPSFSDQHTPVSVSPVLSFPFLSVGFCQSDHLHTCTPLAASLVTMSLLPGATFRAPCLSPFTYLSCLSLPCLTPPYSPIYKSVIKAAQGLFCPGLLAKSLLSLTSWPS